MIVETDMTSNHFASNGRIALHIWALLQLFLLLQLSSEARTQTPPTRDDYVWHVYVDPLHGDDSRATSLNPKTTSPAGKRPLAFHPEPGTPKPIGGVLQHAPYAFKTLSGATGAIAYVNQQFFSPYPSTKLPWQNPETQKWVKWIVVHCRPGLYGPTGPGLSVVDPISMLPWNGETWPIILRDNVSLQGTSALDTILDARSQTKAIIEVNEPVAGGSGETHAESFIDSLSLRGARGHQSQPPDPMDGAGAAIHIRNRGHESAGGLSRITITNCFIYNNTVGIAVNGWSSNPQASIPHMPRVINNTIAWNRCGVWSYHYPGNASFVPAHLGSYLNNIFDSQSPPNCIAGVTGFEGLQDLEVLVTRLAYTPSQPTSGLYLGNSQGPIPVAFNAWEYGGHPSQAYKYINTGLPIAMNWPSAPSRTGQDRFPQPKVNLAPYTKGANGRGALYISDVLRIQPPQAIPAGYDYSGHDFRLAPMTTENPTSPTWTPNPLVNQGLEVTGYTPTGAWPIELAANPIARPPGLPSQAESCPVHGWDWDAEGLGNPRIASRPGFPDGVVTFYAATPPAPDNLVSKIDIGADELGTLIIAGYVPDTRMFYAHTIPGQSAYYDQTAILFFELPGLPGPFLRPQTNILVGGRLDVTLPLAAYDWFKHKLVPDDASAGNHTTIPIPFYDPSTSNPGRGQLMQLGYESVERALECDFGGTLLPDMHPRWPVSTINAPWPSTRDEYGSSPWFGMSSPPLGLLKDNPALYHNIGGDSHQLYGYTFTAVVDATVCPPGALVYQDTYVDWTYGLYRFGWWGPCGGGSAVGQGTPYSVASFGYGDASTGCLDRAPYFAATDSLGIRWNCQNAGTNLQSFLTITTEYIPGDSGSRRRVGTNVPQLGPYSASAAASFSSRLMRAERKE